MKSIYSQLIIIIVFLLYASNITATEKDIQVSLNIGVGLALNTEIDFTPPLAGLINANISIDNLLLSVRNQRMVEFPQFLSSSNVSEYARDIAIMVGYRNRKESSYLDLSIGIAHNSGLMRGEFKRASSTFIGPSIYEKIYYSNLGFALELSIFQSKREVISWGLTLFGNINERSTFFGVTLNYSIFYRNTKQQKKLPIYIYNPNNK